jgi:hypothetical protein
MNERSFPVESAVPDGAESAEDLDHTQELLARRTKTLGRTALNRLLLMAGTLSALAGAPRAEAAGASTADPKTASEQESRHAATLTTEEAQVLIDAVNGPTDQVNGQVLTDAYDRFPDDQRLREQVWEKVYPEFSEFKTPLGRITTFSKAYRMFIMPLQSILLLDKVPDWLRREDGSADRTKLLEQMEKVVSATAFAERNGQLIAIHSLQDNSLVDLFKHPETLQERGWEALLSGVHSDAQGMFLQQVMSSSKVNGHPVQTPEELEPWVEAAQWIDSEEEQRLLLAAHGNRSLKRLAEWRPFVEKVCASVPLVNVENKSVRMGVPPNAYEAIYGFLMNAETAKLTVEEAERQWVEIQNKT